MLFNSCHVVVWQLSSSRQVVVRQFSNSCQAVISFKFVICHQLSNVLMTYLLKVAFIQKAWMNLSFLQTDKPHYFPELEF